MKVEDLLNPVRNQIDGQELRSGGMQAPSQQQPQEPAYPSRSPSQSLSYTSSPSMTYSPSIPSGRKQRLRKDAPIIRKAQTKGVVQFPAHEAGDDEVLTAQYEVHQITPRGNIVEHCHKYPYSSDKKEFQENTGRDGFEVFQYTYVVPGDAKEYTVMWDYNIGLVRITPFFKSCLYSKTTPAKVLNINPGLKNISYSITGGALAAQGYWMPFQCARAVAETFAYSIRYALVPIFGRDFPNSCLRPEHPNYSSFKIDPAIVAHCGTETRLWPLREDARTTPASSRAPSEALDTPRPERNILQSKQFKELRPKLASKATSPESGYGTDTDGGNSLYSPAVSPAPSTWASINRPETPISMSATQLLTPVAVVIPSFGANNDGGVTPVKSYTPSELKSANALLQLRRKEVLHHGLVPPILSPSPSPSPSPSSSSSSSSSLSLSSTPTYSCLPKTSTPISRSANARSGNDAPQAKRKLSYLDTGYVADRSSVTSEISGLTPRIMPTPTVHENERKFLLFDEVAKKLMSPLKSGTGEEFETAHRQKRPRFMSV